MTNAETLAKVILDIEATIAAYLEPGHQRDPRRTLEEILLIMDRANAVEVADRVKAGYTGPRLVK